MSDTPRTDAEKVPAHTVKYGVNVVEASLAEQLERELKEASTEIERLLESIDALTTGQWNVWQRGSHDGRKRLESDLKRDDMQAKDRDFYRQIVVSLAPEAMTCQGWMVEGVAVNDVAQRANLLRRWADRIFDETRHLP